LEHQLSSFQKFIRAILQGFIRIYQLFFAPLLGYNCRYLPSCSTYGIEAIERYGPVRGSWLTFKRVCRCHPWGGAGLDPVPSREADDQASKLTPDRVSATMLSRG